MTAYRPRDQMPGGERWGTGKRQNIGATSRQGSQSDAGKGEPLQAANLGDRRSLLDPKSPSGLDDVLSFTRHILQQVTSLSPFLPPRTLRLSSDTVCV